MAQEASSTAVIVHWLPPASSGNCAVSSYTVEYRQEGKHLLHLDTVSLNKMCGSWVAHPISLRLSYETSNFEITNILLSFKTHSLSSLENFIIVILKNMGSSYLVFYSQIVLCLQSSHGKKVVNPTVLVTFVFLRLPGVAAIRSLHKRCLCEDWGPHPRRTLSISGQCQ